MRFGAGGERTCTIGMMLNRRHPSTTKIETGRFLYTPSQSEKSAEGLFLIIVACGFTEITLGFKLVAIFTLQDRCRETIVSTCIISKKPDIDQLSTSTKIKVYLKIISLLHSDKIRKSNVLLRDYVFFYLLLLQL